MRIRMTVSYRGTSYAGWQVQPEAPTVQGTLQDIVARVAETEIKIIGASRTDAGVHAEGQVCHFDAPKPWPPDKWQQIFNRLAPGDIRIVECREADDDFHSRYGAIGKTYRYDIDPRPVASVFSAPFAWHCSDLDRLAAMRHAAQLLEGTFDQRVFATQPKGDRHLRKIDSVTITEAELVSLLFRARSFMRHAVRGMVGSLVEVGYGRRSVDEIGAMIRREEGHPPMVKAPAHGLFLVRVDYPEPC